MKVPSLPPFVTKVAATPAAKSAALGGSLNYLFFSTVGGPVATAVGALVGAGIAGALGWYVTRDDKAGT